MILKGLKYQGHLHLVTKGVNRGNINKNLSNRNTNSNSIYKVSQTNKNNNLMNKKNLKKEIVIQEEV